MAYIYVCVAFCRGEDESLRCVWGMTFKKKSIQCLLNALQTKVFVCLRAEA